MNPSNPVEGEKASMPTEDEFTATQPSAPESQACPATLNDIGGDKLLRCQQPIGHSGRHLVLVNHGEMMWDSPEPAHPVESPTMTNWRGVYSGSSAGAKDARMETERLACEKCGGLQEQCVCPDPDGLESRADICGAVNKYNHYVCDLTPPGHRGFHAAWRINGRGESYNELWPHTSCSTQPVVPPEQPQEDGGGTLDGERTLEWYKLALSIRDSQLLRVQAQLADALSALQSVRNQAVKELPLDGEWEALKAAAEKATQATWTSTSLRIFCQRGIIADCPTPQKGGTFDCSDNVIYITAASPENIKKLLSSHASLRSELSQAREKIGRYPAKWWEDSSLKTWFPFTNAELSAAHDEVETRSGRME